MDSRMIIVRSKKTWICLNSGSLRYSLRQRCVDLVANARGHIVERRAEKRGFNGIRHAIARQRARRLGCGWAVKDLTPAPNAGSDIGCSCHAVFSKVILGIETYPCSDCRAALLDTKVRARASSSDAVPRCLIAASGALEV